MTFADQRRAYRRGALDDRAAAVADPLATLVAWIAEATEAGEPEATAMALATVAADGTPSVRHLLCKGIDARGLRFYTGLESRKGRELAATGRAAVSFWWPQLERSVRLVGPVEQLPRDEVEAYFRTRPHGSRIGAWASQQSQPIGDRASLEAQERAVRERFAEPEPMRPPERWGGYELIATEIELWHGREDRLHDRLRFTRADAVAAWQVERLQP